MSLQQRPWRLIFLTSLVAIFQFGAVLRSLSFPAALAAQTSLWLPLEVLASSLWALIFVGLAVNLVRDSVSRWLPWVYAGFIVYSALRLLIFAQADYDQARRPSIVLAMLLTVAVLATRSRQR